MEKAVKRALLAPLIPLLIATVVAGGLLWHDAGWLPGASTSPTLIHKAYLYYMLKDSAGFVLARAPKGLNGQPLGQPQRLMPLGNGFGSVESDSIASMQLSPDGDYLAIDGVRDQGEQVWMYDTVHETLALTPAAVIGNFLHWLPGGNGHSFLYRPMFPMGPNALPDSSGWYPGLWIVDATSGNYKNIDIGVPSADLVDAAPAPDGSRIVYSITSGLGLGSDAFLMNSDGSKRTHIFSAPGGAQSVAGLFTWSPDGSRIAYERLSDSSTPFLPASLWVMDSLGLQQQRLADVDGGHGYPLAWSPDGSKIAFVARINVHDHLADMLAQSLQSAIGVVTLASHRSWLVASVMQTGRQLNINPSWTWNSSSITFTALDAINRVVGGSPQYWSTGAISNGPQIRIRPITSVIPHFIAVA